MNYVENAISGIGRSGDRYEAKMYWLATIVSGAPSWLAWYRMGGHGRFRTMDSGGATIEHLAPGSRELC